MTTYTLRDKENVAKATIPASIVFDVFARDGEWETGNYKRGKRSQFIVGGDMAYVITRGGETITLYLWKGDKIVLD